jgi:hypothetical protein
MRSIVTSAICVISEALCRVFKYLELVRISDVVFVIKRKRTKDARIKTADIHVNRAIPSNEVVCAIRKSLT